MKTIATAIVIAIVSIFGYVGSDSKPSNAGNYAFVNVNVIPMDTMRMVPNQTVVITGERITSISEAAPPEGATVIDAAGKYLIPGLIDMHTHLFSDYEFPDELAVDELRVMLANGVTTTRLMIGVPEHLALREQSRNSEILAPRIYAASPQLSGRAFGEIFNGFEVKTPAAAREAVRAAKKDGYDFIKITFFLSLPVYEAIVDEAAKHDIRVIGHVNRSFGIDRAFAAAQQIEHLDGYFEAMLPKGSERAGSTSGVWVWNADAWESIDELDPKKVEELAKKTVEANPFTVPTLTFLKYAFGVGQTDEAIRTRVDYNFLPEKIRREMAEPRDIFWKKPPAEARRWKYVDYRNKITKAIYEAGGKVMAGSDAPEWFLLYGFSLHRELKSLSEAGLPNYAVLEAATKNPAEFFGALDDYGTIEKGKIADLVLLDENPLEDISNTQKIAGVMTRGRWLPKTRIDAMLGAIEDRFRTAFDPRPTRFGDKPLNAGEIFRGTFSQDGKTFLYFKKVQPRTENYRIFESKNVDGVWSKPKITDLGGEYSDLYPALSRDGKRLVFASYRPAPGDTSENANAHLWMAERTPDGWSKPAFLRTVSKFGHYHGWVEFGWDGDLFFRRTTPDWSKAETLRASWNGTGFDPPRVFEEAEKWRGWKPGFRFSGGSPGPTKDLIFLDIGAENPVTGRGASDIWVTRKVGGVWQDPTPLGPTVNIDGFDVFPFFSPDGRTMYFVRDFDQFYRISTEDALKSMETD